jgi:predicted phosphoribosyltransferase
VNLAGRDLIVVDDAADTAVVAQAAAEFLRRHGAARLIFATPIASDSAMERLRDLYDEVVVGQVKPHSTVLDYYGHGVPSDEEIHDCMVRAWDASPDTAVAQD